VQELLSGLTLALSVGAGPPRRHPHPPTCTPETFPSIVPIRTCCRVRVTGGPGPTLKVSVGLRSIMSSSSRRVCASIHQCASAQQLKATKGMLAKLGTEPQPADTWTAPH